MATAVEDRNEQAQRLRVRVRGAVQGVGFRPFVYRLATERQLTGWVRNDGDGVVAEVIFPNTVPPFYGKAFHVSPPPRPEQYRRWRAGTRAHNRWLADFCAEAPGVRAGIGLIHLNDVDDAIEDVAWIAEHGLRGGVLLPLPAPDDAHLEPLNSPHYDRLWQRSRTTTW